MTDIQRRGTTARYADSVAHAGVVYVVEVPASTDADIRTQTRETLAGLERLLQDAGSDKSRILMATIYLVDMADYDGMNEVWDAWLPDGCAPARACVRVAGLARPGWRVEIALNAALR
ncbi:RidA family protein [Pseudothauera rhizosphaerae]|uniref:RidA family protein n=1 Tax=Pseudothauera rhizosphaerae TaxID=2565932 RepID=A0A4S4AJ71_9RHOO|nr:RidA family protein [Pseudothauera rhizosphaerae]THF59445.1 RidA family protein [Pseudothauera rhizosphaerae]